MFEIKSQRPKYSSGLAISSVKWLVYEWCMITSTLWWHIKPLGSLSRPEQRLQWAEIKSSLDVMTGDTEYKVNCHIMQILGDCVFSEDSQNWRNAAIKIECYRAICVQMRMEMIVSVEDKAMVLRPVWCDLLLRRLATDHWGRVTALGSAPRQAAEPPHSSHERARTRKWSVRYSFSHI